MPRSTLAMFSSTTGKALAKTNISWNVEKQRHTCLSLELPAIEVPSSSQYLPRRTEGRLWQWAGKKLADVPRSLSK